MCLPKMDCLTSKLHLELGLYRFAAAEVGVAKIQNKVDLPAIIIDTVIKFDCPGNDSF